MQDSYLIPVFIAGTIMFVVLAFFIVFFVIINKQQQAELIFEAQSKLIKARFEEQERTMTQISKEVHDNLGGWLNLATMNAKVVRELIHDTHQQQIQIMDDTITILTNLISEAHDISHSLNSDYIRNRGLFDILQSQLTYINASKKMQCTITLSGEAGTLIPDDALLVYRIAQEAIQNILKHASASIVNIQLQYSAHRFTMHIHDNGCGFNQQKIATKTGLGIMNMQERTKLLNGKLIIESAPGKGCGVFLGITQPNIVSV